MAVHRFIHKTPRRKFVRLSSSATARYTVVEKRKADNTEQPLKTADVPQQDVPIESSHVSEPETTKKKGARKRQKKSGTEMNNDDKQDTDMDNIEKLKEILGKDVEIAKRKIHVEKKDKGLIERTENSAILLTEDNKILLND